MLQSTFLWANIPPEYKLANSINIFKRKLKNWKGENCPCGYAKRTLQNWATVSFPRILSISVTFFFLSFFNIVKKTFIAQPFTEKKINESL